MLPLLATLYLVSSLDRANIGNAKIEGLSKDLKLSGVEYNTALSVFFISYILFSRCYPPWSIPQQKADTLAQTPQAMSFSSRSSGLHGISAGVPSRSASSWPCTAWSRVLPGWPCVVSCWVCSSKFGPSRGFEAPPADTRPSSAKQRSPGPDSSQPPPTLPRRTTSRASCRSASAPSTALGPSLAPSRASSPRPSRRWTGSAAMRDGDGFLLSRA